VWTEPGTQQLQEPLIRRVLETVPRETLLNFYTADLDFDLTPLLSHIQVPTLILHGAEDKHVPVASAHYLAARIPGAQLYLFKGRAHGLVTTATAELARVVRTFVHTGQVSENASLSAQ
jgi:pimeloyl-ACP methyl ester carboxylesterase